MHTDPFQFYLERLGANLARASTWRVEQNAHRHRRGFRDSFVTVSSLEIIQYITDYHALFCKID
jgi:hypothetical protein